MDHTKEVGINPSFACDNDTAPSKQETSAKEKKEQLIEEQDMSHKRKRVEDDINLLKAEAEFEMRRKLDGEDDHSDIGRFDYAVRSALEDMSFEGYLMSCNIRRERSCIREGLELLKNVVEPCDNVDGNCKQELNAIRVSQGQHQLYNAVKVSACGVVMLGLKEDSNEGVLDTVVRLHELLDTGKIPKRPRFVHRIVPIHSSCSFDVDSLSKCAARLAPKAVELIPCLQEEGCSFSVSFNSRRNRETSKEEKLKTRTMVINAVAKSFESELRKITGHALKVSLTDPTVVIRVEQITVMGHEYGAVGVCTRSICNVKPVLVPRSLIQNPQ